jgi:hypothetical protein
MNRPTRSNRQVVLEAFQGLVFFKRQDVDYKSIYAAHVSSSSSSSSNSFVTVVCPRHQTPQISIGDVCIDSIQTRMLTPPPRSKIQVWRPGPEGYNLAITKTKESREQSTFMTQDEMIEVLIIHNPKKKDPNGQVSSSQYPAKMSILGALETWSCVLHFKDEVCKFEYV